MRERYIAPAIMLAACAITCVVNFINEIEFLEGLKRLLIVLIVFYIIGRIAAKILMKVTIKEITLEEVDSEIENEKNPLSEEEIDIKEQ